MKTHKASNMSEMAVGYHAVGVCKSEARVIRESLNNNSAIQAIHIVLYTLNGNYAAYTLGGVTCHCKPQGISC